MNGTAPNATVESNLVFDGARLGIGTTLPGAKLHVASGEIRVDAGQAITLDTANNMYLVGAQNQLRLYNGGSPALNITTAGNVGIGTTTPSEKLEVAGKTIIRRTGTATAHTDTDLLVTDATAVGSTAQLEILGGNAGNSMLYFSDTDSYSQGAIQYLHSSDSMNFRVNASTAMSIDSSRNVGIGTTSPAFKLDVESTSLSVARFKSTGTKAIIYLSEADEGGLISTEANRLCFGSGAGVSTANMNYHMGTERLGIGTASPSAKLDVVGDLQVKGVNISNQENLDVDTGTETIATVAIADYDAAFFDYVIKNGTDLRAGAVFAVHNGTSVEFTETSTSDLGNTSRVTLSVDISGADMRLRATATSDNWVVKSLVRTI